MSKNNVEVNNVSQVCDWYQGDCGIACFKQIISYFDPLKSDYFSLDKTAKLLKKPYVAVYTTIRDMLGLGTMLGFNSMLLNKSYFTDIMHFVDKKIPIVALVNYRYLPHRYSEKYDDNHFIVVSGYNTSDRTVTYNDTFWKDSKDGQGIEIPLDNFLSAWANIYTSKGMSNVGILYQKDAQ